MSADPLDPFSAPTQAWFRGAFASPTEAQAQGWAAISGGQHALVLAPTGSGKTLAAFLWALDRLLSRPAADPGTGGVKVLYVSPLKALSYDVERNLRSPLTGIANEAARQGVTLAEVTVATRTGDTPAADRQRLAKHPPDILITTPESLYLLLTSKARDVLAGVEQVIIDEIHAVAATKRGAHLALSLERLDRLVTQAGNPSPQRVGLSATQRPLEELARFLGGRARDADGTWDFRPVTVVDAGVRKPLELQVVVSVEDMGQLGKRVDPTDEDLVFDGGDAEIDRDPAVTSSIWPSIHPEILDLIEAHRSTIVFVNSRRLSERLATALNELWRQRHDKPDTEELVRAHHGSLAREQRLEIEDALKAGRLPGLVATSSLELGIDMGAVDLVVQVEAPSSVASGLQRVGRAGHQVDVPSRGRIFPKFRGDLVVAAVAAQRMHAGLVEHTRVPRNPVDVLAQQIVAQVAGAPGGSSVDEVAELAAATYNFSELTRDGLENVIDMLAGRYPSDEFAELRARLNWDRVTGALTARPGARMLAVTSGGTIPDRGLYGVFTPGGGRVGELDEEMVYESRVGETFLLGATTWRIEDIDKDRVTVTPAPGVPGKMPFWHGDNLGRPLELGRAVGEFFRTAETLTDEQLAADYDLNPLAITNLRAYLGEQLEATGALPTDRQIVVERFRDELGDWRVCILSPFGAKVHAPWALAIEAQLAERGTETQCIWSDDGIVVRLPEADDAPPADAVLISPDEISELVTNVVGNSAVFAGRFRENAARSLLLPRRRPGSRTPLWQQRQRSANLLGVAARYGEFPILLETYRECLRDVFDLPGLTEVLAAIRARRIRVVQVDTDVPSPFASSLVFSYVASFIYEGDAPLAERRAHALTLDRRLLAELVGADELREFLNADVLDQLELELACLVDNRRAASLDHAVDLLRRLGDLTPAELVERCTPEFATTCPVTALVASRQAVRVRITGEERLIAAEDAGRYRDALGCALPVGIPEAFLAYVPDAVVQLVRRWARTHGPFHTHQPAQRFGVPLEVVADVLVGLEAAGTLTRGGFRPGGTDREWVDAEVLATLRARSLATLRKEVEPTEVAAMARFLPAWHGIGSGARGLDRLAEVVEQLNGAAIPASVLEPDILAARMEGYQPAQLDELVATGEVLWVGAGSLGKGDGKVRLLLRDTAPGLLRALATDTVEPPDQPEHRRLRALLAQRGACFFRELMGTHSSDALDALWDLVWAGEVTNDTLGALRGYTGKGGAGSRRARAGAGGLAALRRRPRVGRLSATGPPSAAGRWTLVARDLGLDVGVELDEPGLPLPPGKPRTEDIHLVAAMLLERHGVLTREAVRGEGVPRGFSGVYPVLKAMEESGRIRRGYFVERLGGAQFALAGAVDRLRAFRETTPNDLPRVRLLAATDPAQPYGLSLPWPRYEGSRPQRVADAWVAMVDGRALAYVEKGARGIQLLADLPVDAHWPAEVAGLVAGLADSGRLRRVQLTRWPDELTETLTAAGFTRAPKGLVHYGSTTAGR